MMTKTVVSLLFAASILPLGTPASAADALHSGEWSAEFVKQEARPLGGPDHIVVSAVAVGKNKSKGTQSRTDGAQVLMSDMIEIKQGNGPQNGLFTLVDGKGSLTASYTGRVTTTMVDGQPKTTGEGTWHYVSGSGGYAEVKEAGTYAWTMTSPTALKGTWTETVRSAAK